MQGAEQAIEATRRRKSRKKPGSASTFKIVTREQRDQIARQVLDGA